MVPLDSSPLQLLGDLRISFQIASCQGVEFKVTSAGYSCTGSAVADRY